MFNNSVAIVRVYLLLFLFLTGLIFVSCGKNGIWSEEKAITSSKWCYADSIQFTYDNTEKTSLGLVLQLDVKDDYAYQNVWLKINVISPEGKQQSSVSEFILMDQAGNWYAKQPLFSKIRKFETEFPSKLQFSQKGKYTFRITQFMREDTLKNIERIGLKLI